MTANECLRIDAEIAQATTAEQAVNILSQSTGNVSVGEVSVIASLTSDGVIQETHNFSSASIEYQPDGGLVVLNGDGHQMAAYPAGFWQRARCLRGGDLTD